MEEGTPNLNFKLRYLSKLLSSQKMNSNHNHILLRRLYVNNYKLRVETLLEKNSHFGFVEKLMLELTQNILDAKGGIEPELVYN